jgi:hypothetical protein
MLEELGLIESAKMFSYLMLSLAFYVGLMLIISQDAIKQFNHDLQKEMGLKKRVVPKLEDTNFHFVDWLLLKYPTVAGLIISILAFQLLLLNK